MNRGLPKTILGSMDPENPPEGGPTQLVIEERDDGKRADRVLRKRYPRLKQPLLQKLLRKGKITRSGKRLAASDRVQTGDRLELWVEVADFEVSEQDRQEERERRKRSRGFDRKFHPLFEDEHLIVLDKRSGQVVHPAKNHHHGDTLLDLLMLHWPDHFREDSPYRPGFVHRLDQGTSGLIVAARTREAARALESSFRERRVSKRYDVLVKGRVERDSGKIELEIGRRGKPRGPTRYWAVGGRRSRTVTFPAPGQEPESKQPAENFKSASTRFEVVERHRGTTWLRVELDTGRTHQIRVHFSAIGHPVLGDGDYGDRALNRTFREKHELTRLFLHASRLVFPHPVTGETIKVESRLPPPLWRVIERLR